MITLFFAIVAHYTADFPLQGDFLANMKGKYDYLLFAHCIIWTGCICAVLIVFGEFTLWKGAMLLVGHFFIDRWKARKVDKTHALTRDLWIDQALHILQIVAVTL